MAWEAGLVTSSPDYSDFRQVADGPSVLVTGGARCGAKVQSATIQEYSTLTYGVGGPDEVSPVPARERR
jgi:hypothetical protein